MIDEAVFDHSKCQMSVYYKYAIYCYKLFVLSYVAECVYCYTHEELVK